MDYDSFRVFVKKAVYEDRNGPLPGNPNSPTSSVFVVAELKKLGFAFDYLAKPAGNNTCFPTVIVYTMAHCGLPIERAIQLIRASKPKQARHRHGMITARYGREPIDPDNYEHYRFFLRS